MNWGSWAVLSECRGRASRAGPGKGPGSLQGCGANVNSLNTLLSHLHMGSEMPLGREGTDGTCDSLESLRAQQPTPQGHEEPSEGCWPGHDALCLTLPPYHLRCPEPSSERTLLPPALRSLREGSLWGVNIWEDRGVPVETTGED